MNRLITVLWGTMLAISGLIAIPSAHAADSAATRDKAAIEALESHFAAAVNARDLDGIMSVYLPGSTLFLFDVNPPRQYVGWPAVKGDWEGLLKAFPGSFHVSMSDLSIAVVGPVAYGHSIQRYTLTRANGSKVDSFVRVTDVYRKLHGRWLIVQEHASWPVEPDTFKADLLSRP